MSDAPPDGPPQTWFERQDWRRSWVGPVVVGVAYGLLARLVFGVDAFSGLFEVMSLTFIVLVPAVIGGLAVLWHEPEVDWWAALVFPWVPTLLTIVCTLALAWEGLICAIVWVPISMVCASVGGLIAKAVRRSRSARPMAFALAALPVVFAPVEAQFPDPVRLQTVSDTVVIEADAGAVWREIREVRPIHESELPGSLTYAVGVPRPVAARLEGEGVGAVRYATLEGGVTFVERVTEWEPGRALAFTFDASRVPAAAFDEHVAVGGRYFDVLRGRFEIEPLGPGRVALHLTSEQRLSTMFNAYTRLWTGLFMGDMQATILEVVKARAEAA